MALSQCEDRDREDVMAVTGSGLMIIFLIAVPTVLCIFSICDLVKLAKDRKTKAGMSQERPVFVRTHAISNLINEESKSMGSAFGFSNLRSGTTAEMSKIHALRMAWKFILVARPLRRTEPTRESASRRAMGMP